LLKAISMRVSAMLCHVGRCGRTVGILRPMGHRHGPAWPGTASRSGRETGASVAEATAADYAWFKDHWLREAFCITLVRGLDEVEMLRRLGGERSQPRTLT
jgi:Family of unknown function (DUF6461)